MTRKFVAPEDRAPISGMPAGWVWMYSPTEGDLYNEGFYYTDPKSELPTFSMARHAYNFFTGQTLTVRQLRNQQLVNYEKQGIEVVPGAYKTRTRTFT